MRQRRPSDLQGGDMGSIVEASWHFTKEKHARWATHIIENHVKLCCAPFEGFEFDPESSGQSMSDLCLEHDEALRACDPLALPRDNTLTHLRRDRTNVILDRCDDVQWMVHLGDWEPDDFFSQTCFSLARRFPQVPFVAYTRYEMTVDGYVRRTRASWNGERLQFRQIAGERPLDEDCWDTWEVYDWALAGGKLVRCEGSTSAVQKHFFALLDDAREAAAAGDARAALRFADGAAALPHCADRLEALLCRAEVGRSLRRRAVRRFVSLQSRDVPAQAKDARRIELTEMPLDVGSHVLHAQGDGVQDIDTAGGSVHAELHVFGMRTFFLVDGQYLVDDQQAVPEWWFIDWEYEL